MSGMRTVDGSQQYLKVDVNLVCGSSSKSQLSERDGKWSDDDVDGGPWLQHPSCDTQRSSTVGGFDLCGGPNIRWQLLKTKNNIFKCELVPAPMDPCTFQPTRWTMPYRRMSHRGVTWLRKAERRTEPGELQERFQ
jgi:hypothetical protein